LVCPCIMCAKLPFTELHATGVNANIEQLLLGIQRELRQLREGQQDQLNRMNQMAEGFRGEIRELRHGLERIDKRVDRIEQRVEQTGRKVDELKDQGNRVEQMSVMVRCLFFSDRRIEVSA
jgi:archaellum component FlaC